MGRIGCFLMALEVGLDSKPKGLITATDMKLLLALLAGLALTAYILALADGPSLVDIINKY